MQSTGEPRLTVAVFVNAYAETDSEEGRFATGVTKVGDSVDPSPSTFVSVPASIESATVSLGSPASSILTSSQANSGQPVSFKDSSNFIRGVSNLRRSVGTVGTLTKPLFSLTNYY